MKKFSISGGGNSIGLVAEFPAPEDTVELQHLKHSSVFTHSRDIGWPNRSEIGWVVMKG